MSLLLTIWTDQGELEPDQFVGEVLLDLASADLLGTPTWYQLQEHDHNCSSLPAPSPKCGRSPLGVKNRKSLSEDAAIARQASRESNGKKSSFGE